MRIGYYVNTDYGDAALKAQHEASLEEDAASRGIVAPDPSKHIDKLVRSVLAEKPRVTKFNIKWYVLCHFFPSGALDRFRRGLPGISLTPSMTRRDSAPVPQANAIQPQPQVLSDIVATAPTPFTSAT